MSDFWVVTSAGDLSDHGYGIIVAEDLEGLLCGLKVDDAGLALYVHQGVILVGSGGVGGEHIDLIHAAACQLGIRFGGAGGNFFSLADGELQHLFALEPAVDTGEGHDARGHGVFQLDVEKLPEVQNDTQKQEGNDGQSKELHEKQNAGDDDGNGDDGDASQNLFELADALGALVNHKLKGVELTHGGIPLSFSIRWAYYTIFFIGLQCIATFLTGKFSASLHPSKKVGRKCKNS